MMAAFCTMLTLTACQTYYKTIQIPAVSNIEKVTVVDSLKQQARYFILQSGNQAFNMKDIGLAADQKTFDCTLDTIPYYHQLHLANGHKEKMKYKKDEPISSTVLNEVHFYIQPDGTTMLGQYQLPLDKIQKIEVIKKDEKRTANSHVIGWVSFSVVVLALIVLGISSITFPTLYL